MDFTKLNSLTKYPSILTYHQLGERGRLNDTLTEGEAFDLDKPVYVYEKVDGENARMILLHNEAGTDYVIGSREELLYAKGDRIGNPYGNMAALLTPIAERMQASLADGKLGLTVIYQESYGGKTKAAKNYTSSGSQGYRVFDLFSLTHEELKHLLELPIDQIAKWRDHGGQPFYKEAEKAAFIERWSLDAAPLLAELGGAAFPVGLEETSRFLSDFAVTRVGMDAAGKSEGIIARTADRKMIRKIRFEDYERTFRNAPKA
ncbi:hypothetical protein BBD42_00415 [Paenibacillus sp. BIHB 4019]|uniref:RNA ligase domain-containing protein n=1 Tax=Paenibacillus sp. BIHB 4019 TaxID=1870819 RepID=A0A1B2DBM2_9BACL|nr:RNA ligase family protein [Paenibacillus sp. BIHB 4019]ANY65110.1 hypothetical protein BBD42_00415 [Paenibacillus sp. BIHB 4019]